MSHRHKSGTFLATAIASIADGATAVDGTDFTSRQINVENVFDIAVQLIATGSNSLISGPVTAYFTGSPQKDPVWDTFNDTSQAFANLALTMTTDATERHSGVIDVHGLAWIKLAAVKNAAGYAVTNVNVSFGRSVEIA